MPSYTTTIWAAVITGVCTLVGSIGGAVYTSKYQAKKVAVAETARVESTIEAKAREAAEQTARSEVEKSATELSASIQSETRNLVQTSAEEIRRDTRELVTRQIQLEIEKLIVSSAGSVTSDGRVHSYRGTPFTVTREAEGRFRVNFIVPFKNAEPIVVATSLDKGMVIDIVSVDKTGFTIQGISVASGRVYYPYRHTAFHFVAVEPEQAQ